MYEEIKDTCRQHSQLPPRPNPIHFGLSCLLIREGEGDQSNVYHSATGTVCNHIQVMCIGTDDIVPMAYNYNSYDLELIW